MGKHADENRPLIVVSYHDIFSGEDVYSEWDWTTARWEKV